MGFDTTQAKKNFSVLSHEEKHVKLMTILSELKDSSPLYNDLHSSVSVQGLAISDAAMVSYYSLIIATVGSLDKIHMDEMEKNVQNQKSLVKQHQESDATDADNMLETL